VRVHSRPLDELAAAPKNHRAWGAEVELPAVLSPSFSSRGAPGSRSSPTQLTRRSTPPPG